MAGFASAENSCVVSVTDASGDVGAAVEACSSIGSYSIGGLYDGVWKKLTFQYPLPWKGTFASFEIDGRRYCTSEEPKNCTLMDPYVTREPTVEGRSIVVEWAIGNVTVEQRMELVENRTIIRYSLSSADGTNHTARVRMHIDTQLGDNDGAPIYVPGDGLKTREIGYSGGSLAFGYWKAYNSPDEPTIVSTGNIDPKEGMTYPNGVIVADWKRSKDSAWDYLPEGRPITGDSAVLMYYDLGTLEAGGKKSVQMGYGSSAPVLGKQQGYVGVTEITLNTISGQYCPKDTVVMKVDVLSAGMERSGSVELTVEKDGKAYYGRRESTVFPKDEVRTLQFNWTVPENSSGAYSIRAGRYEGDTLKETKEQLGAIVVDPGRCQRPMLVEVGVAVLSTSVFVLIVVAIGLVLAAAVYLWSNRGSVEFTKYIEGEMVTVKVRNGTQKRINDVMIEDSIPSEAEIRVQTLNALRRQNTLTWEVGTLRKGESATLEYLVKGGRALNDATVKWHNGRKSLSEG